MLVVIFLKLSDFIVSDNDHCISGVTQYFMFFLQKFPSDISFCNRFYEKITLTPCYLDIAHRPVYYVLSANFVIKELYKSF